ncbi:hypothetical protein [Microbacterium sp. K2]|uniref:hypothetical protein n=1 Tax=Microbacterium sp. K2 TaxID=3391827 RepID=UPI003ED90947
MDWGLAVGILGVAISAVTLWFVLLDRAERKRTMSRVSWSFGVTTTVHESANGRREHTATYLRLTNSGGSSGQIQASALVGATVIATDNALVPATVLPGSHHDFKIDRMPAFLTPDTWDAWLTPEKLTGDRKIETLAMLEHTSSDVASTIREYIVDRKVSNSRTVDPADPTLLEPVA